MSLWQPWSLRELVADLQAGTATVEGAIGRSRDRFAKTEPELQAWVSYDIPVPPEPGRLHGVPLGVKDIIDVAGFATRLGSARYADAPVCGTDAPIVSAWRSTGAAILGKTVTAEYAFYAPGPTRNPAAPGHTPGSSSSGSAAAVAAGQVPLAIGTQTGGSATRPAAYCGIASLAITPGRFPFQGVLAMSPGLDGHGVFAATVADLGLAWSALTGAEDVGVTAGRPPRLLLWTGEPLHVVAPSMTTGIAAALRRLRSAGAAVDLFPLDALVADLIAAHATVLRFEIRTERAAEFAIADELGERWRTLRDASEATTAVEYEAARRAIAAGRTQLTALLSDYDAILGPGATGPAPAGLAVTGDPVLSLAWQAVRMPAVGVPGLRDEHGLPLGLQVVALDELTALRTGVWVERHLGPQR
jgi:Asp-tRNA(Asn)/Glu-tRNA(Gln) amidotransferase A subunit family amidase